MPWLWLVVFLPESGRIESERVKSIEVGRAFVERDRVVGVVDGDGDVLFSYRESLPISML